MATLRQLSNLNGSARGQAALGIILEQALIMRFLEQNSGFELDATTFDYLVVDGQDNLQTRAIGGSFARTAKTPPARLPGQLAIYGDGITIDRSHIADAERGLRDMDTWIEREASRRVRKVAKKLDTALMKDPGTGNTMKGLSVILNGTSDIPGFTGVKGVSNAQAYKSGSHKSLDLTDAANYPYFIEGLIKDLTKVDNPSGLVMNHSLFARMYTIARKEAILGESRDLFGRPVNTFNGVPMYAVDDTSIPNNEPDDTATPLTVTTSLYIMTPREMGLSIVTNEGLYYQEWEHLEEKESKGEMFELRMAWKIEDDRSVLRVRNLKV